MCVFSAFIVIYCYGIDVLFYYQAGTLREASDFGNDLTEVLDEAESELGLTKERFEERKAYFEQNWIDIVNTMQWCISLIDDDEEEKNELTDELNYQVEIWKIRKEQFLRLVVAIEGKLNKIEMIKTPCKMSMRRFPAT